MSNVVNLFTGIEKTISFFKEHPIADLIRDRDMLLDAEQRDPNTESFVAMVDSAFTMWLLAYFILNSPVAIKSTMKIVALCDCSNAEFDKLTDRELHLVNCVDTGTSPFVSICIIAALLGDITAEQAIDMMPTMLVWDDNFRSGIIEGSPPRTEYSAENAIFAAHFWRIFNQFDIAMPPEHWPSIQKSDPYWNYVRQMMMDDDSLHLKVFEASITMFNITWNDFKTRLDRISGLPDLNV